MNNSLALESSYDHLEYIKWMKWGMVVVHDLSDITKTQLSQNIHTLQGSQA